MPQGSILNPLLFFLYISDLQNCGFNVKLQCYKDDTQMYKYNKFGKCIALNVNLYSVFPRCSDHSLAFNASKSAVMIFGCKTMRDTISDKIKLSKY